MRTFINGSECIDVEHGLPVEPNSSLYGIQHDAWGQGFGNVTFVVMADSCEDAIAKFRANLENVRLARGDYDSCRGNDRLGALMSANVIAEKLNDKKCYPVSYFDDSRSI